MQTSRILRPIRESLLNNNPRKTRILSCLSEDFDVKVTEDHQGFQFSCFKGGARRREKEIKREFERRGGGGGGEIVTHSSKALRDFLSLNCLKGAGSIGLNSFVSYHRFLFRHDYCSNAADVKRKEIDDPRSIGHPALERRVFGLFVGAKFNLVPRGEDALILHRESGEDHKAATMDSGHCSPTNMHYPPGWKEFDQKLGRCNCSMQ